MPRMSAAVRTAPGGLAKEAGKGTHLCKGSSAVAVQHPQRASLDHNVLIFLFVLLIVLLVLLRGPRGPRDAGRSWRVR